MKIPVTLIRMILIHALPLLVCMFDMGQILARHFIISGCVILVFHLISTKIKEKGFAIVKSSSINWIRVVLILFTVVKIHEAFQRTKMGKKMTINDIQSSESESFDQESDVLDHKYPIGTQKTYKRHILSNNGSNLVETIEKTPNLKFLESTWLDLNVFLNKYCLFITTFLLNVLIYLTYTETLNFSFSFKEESILLVYSLESLTKIFIWFFELSDNRIVIILLIVLILTIRKFTINDHSSSLFLKSVYESLSTIYGNDYVTISHEYKAAIMNRSRLDDSSNWFRPWCIHLSFLLEVPFNLIFLLLPFIRVLIYLFIGESRYRLTQNNSFIGVGLLCLALGLRLSIFACLIGVFVDFTGPIRSLKEKSKNNQDEIQNDEMVSLYSSSGIGSAVCLRMIFYGLIYGIVKEKWIEIFLTKYR